METFLTQYVGQFPYEFNGFTGDDSGMTVFNPILRELTSVFLLTF